MCRFGETCVGLALPVFMTVACSQAIHRVGVLIAYNEAESAATAAMSKDIVLFLNLQLLALLCHTVLFEVWLTSTCRLIKLSTDSVF